MPARKNTIAGGRVRALTKPGTFTPLDCRSEWQRGPGKRSTYQRGQAVQTTGLSPTYFDTMWTRNFDGDV